MTVDDLGASPAVAVHRSPHAPTRSSRALGRVGALGATMVIAGSSLALLVGRDGTLHWQLLRAAVVLVVTIASVVLQERVEARARGALAIAFGLCASVIGVGFLPHLVKSGVTLTGVVALVAVGAGVVLLVGGGAMLLRGCGVVTRVIGAIGLLVLTLVVGLTAVPAVMATNVPHLEIDATPASKNLEYESVTLRADDGVKLAAWYIPSRNDAAVVLLHGAGSTRSDVLDEAKVLARNGFAVLLLDARGHGGSEGRAMDFGWDGDSDVRAATEFLSRRDDVDSARIGAVGMSMGGEEAIGASAAIPQIRAVVAEGATARIGADQAWLSQQYGVQGFFQEQLLAARDVLTDVLTTASKPRPLREAVQVSKGTRYLLITAGAVPDEAHAAAYIAAAAPARVQHWNVAAAEHTGGLAMRPRAWEQRVIGFLTRTLAVDRQPAA